MDDLQIFAFALWLGLASFIFVGAFFFPKRYDVIDNAYEIKRSGFMYYVITYGEKRRKQWFWNYSDCIAYIEQRKKEDE